MAKASFPRWMIRRSLSFLVSRAEQNTQPSSFSLLPLKESIYLLLHGEYNLSIFSFLCCSFRFSFCKYLLDRCRAKKSLWARDHENNQEQGVNDHSVFGEFPQSLG